MLNDNSKIPKYLEIRKWLYGMIQRGKYPIGSKLPTEVELAERFNVNRMTVRQALDELIQEKMISRSRGGGTILINDKPRSFVYKLTNITSFNDDMAELNITPKTKTSKLEVIPAPPEISKALELEPEEKLIYTLRVRYADDVPVLIEHSYIPYEEFQDLINLNLDGALYRLIVEHFNVELDHAEQIFSSVLMSEQEKAIFKLPKRIPCIQLESILFDSSNIPIEYLRSIYRGDRYKFQIHSGKYLFQK